MDWVIYSGLMYFFSVTLYLSLRKLQKRDVPNTINNSLMFFFGWVVFAVLAVAEREALALEFKFLAIIFVATYLFSYLGNRFSLEGIKQAENPGFSLIIQKSYAIYTTIAAVFLFNSEISFKNFIAIIIIVAFMVVMLWQKSKDDDQKLSYKWVIYSFLAFFAFGNLALVSKWLLDEGVTPLARSFYVQLFVTLMFTFDLLTKMNKDKSLKKYLYDRSNYFWFVTIGVSNALFNLFMQYGFQAAPNVGYVNIINAASISAITLLSAIIYKEKLTRQKIIGIIGITAGIVLLLA